MLLKTFRRWFYAAANATFRYKLAYVQHARSEHEVGRGTVHDPGTGFSNNVSLFVGAVAAMSHIGSTVQEVVGFVHPGVCGVVGVEGMHPGDFTHRL